MNEETLKLWSGDDWVIVEPINERTAIMRSISVNIDFGYGDMVLYNRNEHELLQVIKKETSTFVLAYDVPIDSPCSKKTWEKVKLFFDNNGLYSQEFQSGIFFLACPISMDEDSLKELCNQSPIPCYLITEEIENQGDIDGDDDGIFHLN